MEIAKIYIPLGFIDSYISCMHHYRDSRFSLRPIGKILNFIQYINIRFIFLNEMDTDPYSNGGP